MITDGYEWILGILCTYSSHGLGILLQPSQLPPTDVSFSLVYIRASVAFTVQYAVNLQMRYKLLSQVTCTTQIWVAISYLSEY